MEKAYLVSAKHLREIISTVFELRHLAENSAGIPCKPADNLDKILKAILGQEPCEPEAWIQKTHVDVNGLWEEVVDLNRNGNGSPLYRKDM